MHGDSGQEEGLQIRRRLRLRLGCNLFPIHLEGVDLARIAACDVEALGIPAEGKAVPELLEWEELRAFAGCQVEDLQPGVVETRTHCGEQLVVR